MTRGPRWDAKRPVVPVSADGSLLSYGGYASEWVEFAPLDGPLTLIRHARGRSAIHFVWQSADGRTWPMFAADAVDLMKRGTVAEGVAHGVFTASKRGQNYGIRLAPETAA